MKLTDIKGVGNKKKEILNQLDIYTVEDLWTYLPIRYEDRSNKTLIVNAVDGIKQYFEITIDSITKTYFYQAKKSISRLKGSDETGAINLIWYNDRFSSKNLKIGETYKVFGFYSAEKKAIINPVVSKMDDNSIGGIYPVYAIKKGLSSKDIIKYKDFLFSKDIKIDEYLNDEIISKYNLLGINEIYKILHHPKNNIDLYNALYNNSLRNIYLEKLANKIYNYNLNNEYIKFNDYDLSDFVNALGFMLTDSQFNALNEIVDDMTSQKRMNRLLIGDVGSGKTIVAVLSAILAIKNNYQVAFMAPTEILTIQHYQKNKKYLNQFGINCELLLGSSKNKEEIYEDLQSGKIDIIFGTHSLFQERVSFNKLGLIVTDEQQRFGVYQRKMLSDKGMFPDTLLLSATPIPRTLALSLYDNLDLSFIDELPKDRKPIKSYLTSIYKEKDFIDFAYRQVIEGNQAYIVVSRVEDDDSNNLESVDRLYKKLSKYFDSKVRLGKLHGKMDSKKKEKIQADFVDGKIDILIATSIIEVGIDVPSANVIIIYDANQFGLSQLHQIRGRVGRSDIQSYCFFVLNEKNEFSEKLEFIKESLDGYEIAKKDLEMRGSGEMYGTNQSGFIEINNSFFFNEELISIVNNMLVDSDNPSTQLEKIISRKLEELDKIVMN